MLSYGLLNIDCAMYGIDNRRKLYKNAVPHFLHDATAISLKCRINDFVAMSFVALQRAKFIGFH